MKMQVGAGVGITSVLRRYHVGARRALRLGLLNALTIALVACAPGPVPGFRDQSVPITATTRFTPQAFTGDWFVIAAYPNAFLPGCGPQRWQADTASSAPRLTIFCGQGSAEFEAALTVDPRGVMQLQRRDLDRATRALWVMWMAEDAQTAVIGTPGGEMGWIVNRRPGLRSDRLVAARAIMAFNGYDIDRLQAPAP